MSMSPRPPLSVLSILLLGAGCAATQPLPVATTATAPRPPSQPAPAPGEKVPFVYVSGYRPEILIFRLDTAAGRLTPVGSADGGREPSFLAWDPAARFLFAANEVDEGRVVAFAIDPGTGALTRLNDQPSAGFGPAHVSVDRSGKFLLVANYADSKPGTIGVLPIGPDGRLEPPVDRHDFGVASMPHFISADPSNRFVFVPCKGGPHVGQLRFDARTGQLEPNQPAAAPSAERAGPRHLDFHPTGRFAYVINEQALTVSAYQLDRDKGTLTEIETVATVPAEVTDRKGLSTADIHVHPSGKFLYGSNRGHDSVVIFAIDESSGRLRLVGHETRHIARPRNFHIDPSGQLLLVANQASGTVTSFRIDAATGRLDLVGPPTPVGAKPSFVGVVLLPGR